MESGIKGGRRQKNMIISLSAQDYLAQYLHMRRKKGKTRLVIDKKRDHIGGNIYRRSGRASMYTNTGPTFSILPKTCVGHPQFAEFNHCCEFSIAIYKDELLQHAV